MTGRADAQGCDLGSDDQILDRLSRAACHKPWEGSISYTRIDTDDYDVIGQGFSQVQRYRYAVNYTGRLSRLTLQEGDKLVNGGSWAAWTFDLPGKFTAEYNYSLIEQDVTDDWTKTSKEKTLGTYSIAAKGELMLRFDNGKFTSFSASSGLDGTKYLMPLQSSTETVVECRRPECPPAVPLDRYPDGDQELDFAAVVLASRPAVQVVTNRTGFTVSYRVVRVNPNPIFNGQTTVEEIIKAQFTRGQ